MEEAGGTRSRLLLVLVLVAGLLVAGASAARATTLRAPVPAPTATPAAPVAHASGSTGPQRTASRTGGADRAAVSAPSVPTSCGAAGGDCPPPASAGLPEQRGALVGRLPRLPRPPAAHATATQQDRAPPGTAGP